MWDNMEWISRWPSQAWVPTPGTGLPAGRGGGSSFLWSNYCQGSRSPLPSRLHIFSQDYFRLQLSRGRTPSPPGQLRPRGLALLSSCSGGR